MIEKEISDIFIRANSNLRGRRFSLVEVINDNVFSVEDVDNIVKDITSDRDKALLKQNKACEFTYWYKENWRFRVGIFYQRNTLSLVMRKIDLRIPTFEQLNLPVSVLEKFYRPAPGHDFVNRHNRKRQVNHNRQHYGKHEPEF